MALGIYIHIPFCVSKCNYCDFNSFVAPKTLKEEYIDALCIEIGNFAVCNDIVDSIYFGGGTPTILEAEQLQRVLYTVREKFYVADDCEITTECNPATIDYNGFSALKKAGFNRISIGMQSAHNNQLKALGRIHSFEDCRACVDSAREAGFDNISLDLMFGLPDQDMDSWLFSLNSAIALKPNHLSCYSLKIEEGTPFSKMKLNIADDDEISNMYAKCVETLKENGYDRYEVSNFAKSGFESRHNCKYWLCQDFAGFGAGAYSCVDGYRYSNIGNTTEYIDKINSLGSAQEELIPLTNEDKMLEFVFLGLRMDKGISISAFKDRFNRDIFDVYGKEIEKNLSRGTLLLEGDIIKIPSQYTFVGNSILVDFI